MSIITKKRLMIAGGVLGAAWLASTVMDVSGPNEKIPYNNFVNGVKNGTYGQVTIEGADVSGFMANSDVPFTTRMPYIDESVIEKMIEDNVELRIEDPNGGIPFSNILMMALIGVIGWSAWNQYQMTKPNKKSKAKPIDPNNNKTRFKDLAGIDEAKEDVKQMVDYLKNPKKYTKLGGQVPRGALMVGPPGTGKTLLARAIAGEAKVPFFTISGSDFVEKFVGVGASRVRDMFEDAKKNAPCIIFIDEIDAVGKQRGNGAGGNDEREQTLNQMLVEMDGFEGNSGVIVLAATNRADTLDTALLRPGRFDRQIDVGLPDIRGREQILDVHIKKVPQADDIKLKYIAQGTPGLSGADLANIVNEAALAAAEKNAEVVSMADLEKAKDKVLMGAEKTSMIMGEDEKRMTAYHEAGHTIVGRLTPDHDPVYKVSIMPRGRALGITMFLPEKDEHSRSEIKLNSMISTGYGGRVAEEMLSKLDNEGDESRSELGNVTSGASGDIIQCTNIANQMVGKWGIFPNEFKHLPPIDYAPDEDGFGGEKLSLAIKNDTELKEARNAIIKENKERAEKILKDNEDILHRMSDALMKYETIDKYQIDALMDRADIIPEPRAYGEPVPAKVEANNDNDKGDGGGGAVQVAKRVALAPFPKPF